MKPRYVFSKAERGKDYHKKATLHIQIYMEPHVEAQHSHLAEKQDNSDLVAQIVKRDLAKQKVDQ